MMKLIVPIEHKQIDYVAYHPQERALVVTYHSGEKRLHSAVELAQFESLRICNNKVDLLSQLLMQSKQMETL
jgi:hypothetical protein